MKNIIRKLVVAVLVIVVSALSTIASQSVIAKPPEEVHMQRLTTIAEEALEAGYYYEIPEDFKLSFNSGVMTVRSSNFAECGVVKCAPMANGDTAFVLERETTRTTGVAIVVAMFSGMLTFVGSVLILEKIVIKKSKNKR